MCSSIEKATSPTPNISQLSIVLYVRLKPCGHFLIHVGVSIGGIFAQLSSWTVFSSDFMSVKKSLKKVNHIENLTFKNMDALKYFHCVRGFVLR